MKLQERVLLAVMAIGLVLLLIIRDVFGVELSKFIYLVYIVAFMVVAQYQTMVYMICFVFPLVCGLPGTYIMPCVLILLYVKQPRVVFWQIGMLFFVGAIELIASFWHSEIDIAAVVQYISFAGVMFFLIHDNTAMDHTLCIKMYLFGVCVLCGVIIATGVINAPSNWWELFSKGSFRFGETQMAELEGMKLKLNANSLAYYSLTGMCCSALLIDRVKGKSRMLYIALFLLTAIAGYLSVSRSWLVCVGICLLLYILSKARRPKRFLAGFFVLVVILFGAAILIGDVSKLLEAFATRLNEENLETGGNRIQIFEKHMSVFMSDIRLFLLGSGASQKSIVSLGLASMHNGTQQILVSYGLPGFFVFLVALFKPVIAIRREKHHDLIAWLPLIGIILFVQTIQFLNPMMLMLPYVIGVYALKVGGMENEKLHHYSRHRRG